jgi:hypothetical protein
VPLTVIALKQASLDESVRAIPIEPRFSGRLERLHRRCEFRLASILQFAGRWLPLLPPFPRSTSGVRATDAPRSWRDGDKKSRQIVQEVDPPCFWTSLRSKLVSRR